MVVWGQGAGRGIGVAPSRVRRFVASGPSTGVVHVTLPTTAYGGIARGRRSGSSWTFVRAVERVWIGEWRG
jgi:hypothetical protein